MQVSLRFVFPYVLTFVLAAIPGVALLRAQDDAVSRRAAIEAMYPIMMGALEAKNYGRARNICDQAIIWEPQNPIHHYNMACIEARAGGSRLPRALAALELAIALGFDDVKHLQGDPDLVAIRDDPRYQAVVRKLIGQAGRAFGPIEEPAPSATPAPSTPDSSPVPAVKSAMAAEKDAIPAGAEFQNGRPVGLYFMTRFWPATGSLEKAAWYFAADGSVYQNLERGFSPGDLAAHSGRKGHATSSGSELTVQWADGKQTKSKLERDGKGFRWDMGIFTAVKAFDQASEVVGVYEGGESLSGGGGRAAVSKRLELKADGTFTWNGVSFLGTQGEASGISAGSTGGSTGRWRLDGYSLMLTAANGKLLRRIVFPYDDEATPVKPDRMFFGGLLYKRR